MSDVIDGIVGDLRAKIAEVEDAINKLNFKIDEYKTAIERLQTDADIEPTTQRKNKSKRRGSYKKLLASERVSESQVRDWMIAQKTPFSSRNLHEAFPQYSSPWADLSIKSMREKGIIVTTNPSKKSNQASLYQYSKPMASGLPPMPAPDDKAIGALPVPGSGKAQTQSAHKDVNKLLNAARLQGAQIDYTKGHISVKFAGRSATLAKTGRNALDNASHELKKLGIRI